MMTIHSSKGLEFPFVIYSGLTREFNKKDLREQVILNQKYGLGIDYYDIDKTWHILHCHLLLIKQ